MNQSCSGYLCFLALLFLGSAGRGDDPGKLEISSPAFERGAPIPALYAKNEKNIPPDLRIGRVPAQARSLVLIVDDPDAPSGLWTHWLVWNLPAETLLITEGKLPPGSNEGKNSSGDSHYDGPAPPAGTGIHRYFFRLYALDVELSLPEGSNRAALLHAINGHVIDSGDTFGVYQYGPALPENYRQPLRAD